MRTRARYRYETHQVRCGRNAAELSRADVDGQSDDGADERAKLEYSPKDAERLALVLFERIAHHDRSLGGPQQRRGHAEHSTGKNNKPTSALCLVTNNAQLSGDTKSGRR